MTMARSPTARPKASRSLKSLPPGSMLASATLFAATICALIASAAGASGATELDAVAPPHATSSRVNDKPRRQFVMSCLRS
jgi:hypothetical protein